MVEKSNIVGSIAKTKHSKIAFKVERLNKQEVKEEPWEDTKDSRMKERGRQLKTLRESSNDGTQEDQNKPSTKEGKLSVNLNGYKELHANASKGMQMQLDRNYISAGYGKKSKLQVVTCKDDF